MDISVVTEVPGTGPMAGLTKGPVIRFSNTL